jgi:hypothetical protein
MSTCSLCVCVVPCKYGPYYCLIPRSRSATDCVQDQETEKGAKAQQKGRIVINNNNNNPEKLYCKN